MTWPRRLTAWSLALCLCVAGEARAGGQPLLYGAIWGSLASYALAAWRHEDFKCRLRTGLEAQALWDQELTAVAVGVTPGQCEDARWLGPLGMEAEPLLLAAHWTASEGGGARFAVEAAALPRIRHVLPLGSVRLDLQLAVGPAFLSEPDVGMRRKSTQFQFSDELGVGLSDAGGRFRLGWMYRHLSNAGLALPNNTVDFYGASLDARWP